MLFAFIETTNIRKPILSIFIFKYIMWHIKPRRNICWIRISKILYGVNKLLCNMANNFKQKTIETSFYSIHQYILLLRLKNCRGTLSLLILTTFVYKLNRRSLVFVHFTNFLITIIIMVYSISLIYIMQYYAYNKQYIIQTFMTLWKHS